MEVFYFLGLAPHAGDRGSNRTGSEIFFSEFNCWGSLNLSLVRTNGELSSEKLITSGLNSAGKL